MYQKQTMPRFSVLYLYQMQIMNRSSAFAFPTRLWHVQLQRKLQANLAAHKGYMKDRIDDHQATERRTSGVKTVRSTASSCHVSKDTPERDAPADAPATHTRADSASRAEAGKDCGPEGASGDGEQPCGSLMQADDSTLHVASREGQDAGVAATAGEKVAGENVAEEEGVQKDDQPGSPDDHGTDPLISMNDFGEAGLPNTLSDEHGADGMNDLNLPITMPEWGDAQAGIGEFAYGDIFEFSDPTADMLGFEVLDQEHRR